MFDDAPLGVLAVSRSGVIEYVNPRQCENSHLSREFFLGKEYRPTFASTLEAAGLLADYDRLVATGAPFERTFVDYKRLVDGVRISFSLRAFRAGSWTIVISNPEHVLESQQLRYLQLFENANDGVFILSREGTFLEVNRRFCEMAGLPRDALIGQTADIFLPGRMTESRERLERMMEEGTFGPYELEVRTALGIKHISLNGFALVEGGKRSGIINIARDVTEERERADELRAARDQALESGRLKTSFLANMSHEIRTPLNVILGCSSLVSDLLAQTVVERDVTDLLESVQHAGKRLQETIDSILDISRIEAGAFSIAPELVDLAALVERQVTHFLPMARVRDLQMVTEIHERDVVVRFDAYCLNQALINLISNAIKFTLAGSVHVELARDGDGQIVLRVRDTGVGIDPAFLAKVGQPFLQEESGFGRRFEGCGLGLALTRRYLDFNGARLSVSSEKGSGSVFTIHFDGNQGKGVQTQNGADAQPSERRRPPVLVVEDDPETQEFMRVLLRSRYEVSLAATAEAALGMLCAQPVELILMDISLPGGEDGLTFTRMLRADPRWRVLPIIALTAHVFPENRQEAIQAGCNDFVTKPFDARRLFASMAALLVRRDALHPA